MPPQPDDRERVRGVPVDVFRPGRNTVTLAIEPYPGRDRTPFIYVGVMHFVLIR